MTLMLIFGGIAIVLAAVGIYGVVSYAGSLRRDEMATRLALGASPRSVFLLVMRQGATLGLVGAGNRRGAGVFLRPGHFQSRVRDPGVGSLDSGDCHGADHRDHGPGNDDSRGSRGAAESGQRVTVGIVEARGEAAAVP